MPRRFFIEELTLDLAWSLFETLGRHSITCARTQFCDHMNENGRSGHSTEFWDFGVNMYRNTYREEVSDQANSSFVGFQAKKIPEYLYGSL